MEFKRGAMDWGKDSRARVLLHCASVLLLVAAAGFVFDYMLVQEGVKRVDILIESNALTGIVTAVFFYYLTNYERERRKMVRQRLTTIAEMNHHIRNALQVITYAASSQTRGDSVKLIGSSVERIEWSLREVLPGYASAPSASEERHQITHAG